MQMFVGGCRRKVNTFITLPHEDLLLINGGTM